MDFVTMETEEFSHSTASPFWNMQTSRIFSTPGDIFLIKISLLSASKHASENIYEQVASAF